MFETCVLTAMILGIGGGLIALIVITEIALIVITENHHIE
jgi:hypothetical protein